MNRTLRTRVAAAALALAAAVSAFGGSTFTETAAPKQQDPQPTYGDDSASNTGWSGGGAQTQSARWN